MRKVLVLGARGMLGRMVSEVLAGEAGLEVSSTDRRDFDALTDPVAPLLDKHRADWVVNAIGVIKPRIDEREAASVARAVAVNALLPHRLAAEAEQRGQRVIQIATDAVFSGANAPYDESAPHDALDVYGKTKSLGETPAANVVHLRCSIIGPEPPPARSLLGWILSAPPGARLTGFTGQRWNGVTTLHFARLCAAIVRGTPAPSIQHVVPADSLTKAELLERALRAFGREDVTVAREPGPTALDRTLATRDPQANQRLWKAAGYPQPPTVAAMLGELAARPHGAPTGAS